MTDRYPYPDQHDTAAYLRQPPPAAMGHGAAGQATGTATQDWYVPGQATPVGNPEAQYWASRYRSQRTWTRVMAGLVAVATLVLVAVGFAAFQSLSANPLAAAVAQTESPGESDLALPTPGEDGTSPDGSEPLAPPEAQDAPDGSVPLDNLPLPEELQSLAGALGITDVGQLLDLAVANGWMTQDQADQVAAAIAAGQGLQGLLGEGTDQG